jgi:phenylalanine-4-hydroxylase
MAAKNDTHQQPDSDWQLQTEKRNQLLHQLLHTDYMDAVNKLTTLRLAVDHHEQLIRMICANAQLPAQTVADLGVAVGRLALEREQSEIRDPRTVLTYLDSKLRDKK